MTSGLTIVGKRDPQLEELVRASGRVTTVTWLADLSTLTDPKAPQPDVLLVDVRAGRRGAAAAGDTQAPASGDERRAARRRRSIRR